MSRSRHVVMRKLPVTSAHSCSLLNHLNSFCEGMFKLNAKSDADSLVYSLSHFECDGHTVHTLTQLASTSPTDEYSEVIIIQACAFHSTPLGWQVTLVAHKLFLL